jgi:hypothetical protein
MSSLALGVQAYGLSSILVIVLIVIVVLLLVRR